MSTIKVGRLVNKDNGPVKGITPNNSSNTEALATKGYVRLASGGMAGSAGDITNLLNAVSALESEVLNYRTELQPSSTGVTDFQVYAADKKQYLIDVFGNREVPDIPVVEPEPEPEPVVPDTDPNEGMHTTVGGIEFVDSDGTVTGGMDTGHDSGHNTTVGGIEFK